MVVHGKIDLEIVKGHPKVKVLIQRPMTPSAPRFYGTRFQALLAGCQDGAGAAAELAGSAEEVEGRHSGYLHDIGNIMGGGNMIRRDHRYADSPGTGSTPGKIADIAAAIGSHDEQEGRSSIIWRRRDLADKADVHRSRVRNPDFATFDSHDQVNYAVRESH